MKKEAIKSKLCSHSLLHVLTKKCDFIKIQSNPIQFITYIRLMDNLQIKVMCLNYLLFILTSVLKKNKNKKKDFAGPKTDQCKLKTFWAFLKIFKNPLQKNNTKLYNLCVSLFGRRRIDLRVVQESLSNQVSSILGWSGCCWRNSPSLALAGRCQDTTAEIFATVTFQHRKSKKKTTKRTTMQNLQYLILFYFTHTAHL